MSEADRLERIIKNLLDLIEKIVTDQEIPEDVFEGSVSGFDVAREEEVGDD